MSDEFASLILYAVGGFWWGQWYAERKARRQGKDRDVAMRLLTDMLQGILDKRKLLGRGMTIWREHNLDCMGEKLTLTLKSEGDPSELAAIDEGSA